VRSDRFQASITEYLRLSLFRDFTTYVCTYLRICRVI